MQPEQLNTPRKPFFTVAGYAIGTVCVLWVFRDVEWGKLAASFESVKWHWVPVSIFLSLLTYVLIAWEWQFLLRPVGHLSIRRLSQAIFAGRFANDVLPVHIGYVIRLYLASRWMPAKVTALVPSLLVERICEAFWLACSVAVTAAFLPLPTSVLEAAGILAGLLLAGAGAGIALLLSRKTPFRGSFARSESQWRVKLLLLLDQFLTGLHRIVISQHLPVVLALALIKLAVQALAFMSLLWACNFKLPATVQIAVFLIACIGVSLPSTPASAGVFQLFCVTGLTMFGIPKPEATGFGLLAFVVLTAPPALAGFLALVQSGTSLREIKNHAAELRLQLEHERPSSQSSSNAG